MHQVQAERDQVRQRITQKKGEMRRLRRELAQDAARLVVLDAQCQRLGLGVAPRIGAEETHGPHR